MQAAEVLPQVLSDLMKPYAQIVEISCVFRMSLRAFGLDFICEVVNVPDYLADIGVNAFELFAQFYC